MVEPKCIANTYLCVVIPPLQWARIHSSWISSKQLGQLRTPLHIMVGCTTHSTSGSNATPALHSRSYVNMLYSCSSSRSLGFSKKSVLYETWRPSPTILVTYVGAGIFACEQVGAIHEQLTSSIEPKSIKFIKQDSFARCIVFLKSRTCKSLVKSSHLNETHLQHLLCSEWRTPTQSCWSGSCRHLHKRSSHLARQELRQRICEWLIQLNKKTMVGFTTVPKIVSTGVAKLGFEWFYRRTFLLDKRPRSHCCRNTKSASRSHRSCCEARRWCRSGDWGLDTRSTKTSHHKKRSTSHPFPRLYSANECQCTCRV